MSGVEIDTNVEVKYEAPYSLFRHFLHMADGRIFEIVGGELKPAPSPEQQEDR